MANAIQFRNPTLQLRPQFLMLSFQANLRRILLRAPQAKPAARAAAFEPGYQALFVGARAQMQCGVGHLPRLLYEPPVPLSPGSCTPFPLTRSQGRLSEIWEALGSARSLVVNFP